MPAIKKGPSHEELLAAIDDLHGNVAAIARRYRLSRRTIKRRCDRSPSLREALEDARETMKDNAESSLYSRILSGDITAIIFYLKTQAKDRGYIERVEHTGKDGAELVVKPDATVSGIVFRLTEESLPDADAPGPQPGDIMPRGFAVPE
jgi:hypothetical protein